jgi:hypothetical protein
VSSKVKFVCSLCRDLRKIPRRIRISDLRIAANSIDLKVPPLLIRLAIE